MQEGFQDFPSDILMPDCAKEEGIVTEEEPLNGFTGFARRKPGFVPASVSVGHAPVGAGGTARSRTAHEGDGSSSYPFSPSSVSSVAQGAFQYHVTMSATLRARSASIPTSCA